MSAMFPLWLIPAFPLLGALSLGIISLLSSKGEKQQFEGYIGALAVLFPLISFLLVGVLSLELDSGEIFAETLGTWINIIGLDESFSISFGFLFDSLTRIMLLFVTGISTLIVLYSLGYMRGDRGFARFLAYLNLFLFCMVVLVLSDSLPLTFLGWEGVGLCSYLLIGFWHKDLNNCKAADKAFIVNRVGDLGFLLGMFALVALGGTALLNYSELTAFLSATFESDDSYQKILVTASAIFLFFACTGKSAQIPLLTWLPDAMAGPTPVSALIHAATMVTAGVYLVARLSLLFVVSPEVLNLIFVIGLGTALWAAIAGLVQNDIKKVLAYSTVSQLGFMFIAAGVGAFNVAIFHVFTHAFTKASLFLGAGSVIHALGGEQDMRKMGGLAFKLPSTFLIMFIAWASLIGLPGFACFWSKDLIMEKVSEFSFLGYGIALFTALLTAVYMTRLMVLVFIGRFRGSRHTEEHIHESSFVMQLPMWILAVGCVVAGYSWAELIGFDLLKESLAPVLVNNVNLNYAEGFHISPLIICSIGAGVAVLGAIFAILYFSKRISRGSEGLTGFAKHWTFSFDYLHFICGVLPFKIAMFVLFYVQKFLRITIDVLVAIPVICADGLRNLQVGKLRMQLLATIACSLIFIYWLLILTR